MFCSLNRAVVTCLGKTSYRRGFFSANYKSVNGGFAERVVSQLRLRNLDYIRIGPTPSRLQANLLIPSLRQFSCLSGQHISCKAGLQDVHILNSIFNSKRLMSSMNDRKKKNQRKEHDDDDDDDDDDNDDDEEEDEDEEGDDERQLRLIRSAAFFIAATLAFLSLETRNNVGGNEGTFETTWAEFYNSMLVKGEVEKLIVSADKKHVYVFIHPGANINNRMVMGPGPHFMFMMPNDRQLENKLAQAQAELGIDPSNHIPVRYRNEAKTRLWMAVATLGVLYILGSVVGSRVRVRFSARLNQRFQSLTKQKSKAVVVEPGSIDGVKFKDVAGMEEAKQEVMEFIDYLKDSSRFTSLGAKIPKGALLVGPPGTGKTLLAKAVATEAGVPFFAVAGSDFVEVYAGVGPARVRDLFAQAKERAPCIVYVDEVDAIGKARSSGPYGGNMERENTLNQLLVEMDGMNTMEGIVVMASTNREDVLDNALLRPGRFDRKIEIALPTLLERQEIFELYLNNLKLAKPAFKYSKRLAELTPGESGADINNICNEAALHAARLNETKVDSQNFDYAVERIIAGIKKKSHTISPEERKIIAYHEAGHTLVGWMLEYTEALLKVSIAPHTKSVFGYALHLPSNNYMMSLDRAMDLMTMSLGGRAAEALVFKKLTTASQDDLKKITKMARRLIIECGMSPVVGHISFDVLEDNDPRRRMYSDGLQQIMDQEVNNLVMQSWEKSMLVLKEHEDKLHEVAKALMDNEVLSYENIEKILGPCPYGDKRSLTKA